MRMIVIDNGSDDDALEHLETATAGVDDVEVVRSGTNTGFGPAANTGLRRWLAEEPSESSEWAALAPHDALPADGTLERLVQAASARPGAGLACADVGDGHVPVVDPYFGGMTVPAPDPSSEGWEDVDYPHGTLMIARRTCLEAVGLFDERYFAYCEEADLGIRVRDAGWGVGLVRGARVTNPTMRSGSPAVDYLMQRNTLLLVREHSGSYHAFIRLVIGSWQLARGLVRPAPGTFVFSARGRGMGIVDFLRGRFGPPPESMFAEAGEPGVRGPVP